MMGPMMGSSPMMGPMMGSSPMMGPMMGSSPMIMGHDMMMQPMNQTGMMGMESMTGKSNK
jgi:hypothetical protein